MYTVHVCSVKRTMYQRKVDVDMLNAVKSVLADVSNVSPSSEQSSVKLNRDLKVHKFYLPKKRTFLYFFTIFRSFS